MSGNSGINALGWTLTVLLGVLVLVSVAGLVICFGSAIAALVSG